MFAFDRMKGSSPVGYIKLAHAIDAVGRKQFPDGWGTALYFDRLPFFWREADDQFYQSSLKKAATGKLVLKRHRIEVEANQHGHFRRTAEMYTTISDLLRSGLESKQVKAVIVDKLGGYEDPPLAVWAGRRRAIFYAGALGGSAKRRPVFIEEESFSIWLHSLNDLSSLVPKRDVSEVVIQRLVAIAVSRAKDGRYALNKQHVFSCLKEALLSSHLKASERRLERAWRNVSPSAKAPGRPKQEDVALRRDDRDMLIDDLLKAMSVATPRPAEPPRNPSHELWPPPVSADR